LKVSDVFSEKLKPCFCNINIHIDVKITTANKQITGIGCSNIHPYTFLKKSKLVLGLEPKIASETAIEAPLT
jgi:hypothetical protein